LGITQAVVPVLELEDDEELERDELDRLDERELELIELDRELELRELDRELELIELDRELELMLSELDLELELIELDRLNDDKDEEFDDDRDEDDETLVVLQTAPVTVGLSAVPPFFST
jgi:hypothetical protein